MTIFVHMKRFLPLVMGVCITAVSAQDGAPSLDLLKKYLTGSFTNAAQAAKDSTLAVIDLELRRIWLRDTDGVWLYEEQVLRGTKNTHLQGLHHLTRRDDSTWVLAEYRLRQPDQKRHAVNALKGLNYKVIAAGDSYNDTAMLGAADAGFLMHAPPNIVAEFPQFPLNNSYPELLASIDAASARIA